MDEIDKFAELFKLTKNLGFSEITYTQCSDGKGGEICVEYNNMGFSIQLYEEDEDIVVDLTLTTATIGNIVIEYNDLHFTHQYYSHLSDYKSTEEAVQDIALEILTCEASKSYTKIFTILKETEKKLSPKSFEALVDIVKNYY